MEMDQGEIFRILVISDNKEVFDRAIELAFINKFCGQKATHYRVDEQEGLILYWMEPDGVIANKLPFMMEADSAIPFIWTWLQQTEYGDSPDTDGSADKGFCIHNDRWGHIGSEYRAFLAIKPYWTVYGK